MRRSTIEQKATELLKKNKLFNVPVKIKRIPEIYHIELKKSNLGPEVSGVLFVEQGKARIGYSNLESKVRQRFSIAHELGHYLIHVNRENGDALFVDNIQRMYRKQSFSQKEQRRETEANYFAAALLMPEELIVKEARSILGMSKHLSDEEIISQLAKRFEVSEIAMTYRMNNLGLII